MWILTVAPVEVVHPDPLMGWGSLILQGGAFGLLAYIVIWLYPKESDKARLERAERERDSRAERASATAALAEMVDVMQSKFEERNRALIGAVQEQTRALTVAVAQVAERVERAVGSGRGG